MQSVKEIMKEIPNKLENLVPRKKEDTTIRLIIQQDVAENIRQLYKLTDKDIERAGSVLNRIFKAVYKRIK